MIKPKLDDRKLTSFFDKDGRKHFLVPNYTDETFFILTIASDTIDWGWLEDLGFGENFAFGRDLMGQPAVNWTMRRRASQGVMYVQALRIDATAEILVAMKTRGMDPSQFTPVQVIVYQVSGEIPHILGYDESVIYRPDNPRLELAKNVSRDIFNGFDDEIDEVAHWNRVGMSDAAVTSASKGQVCTATDLQLLVYSFAFPTSRFSLNIKEITGQTQQ